MDFGFLFSRFIRFYSLGYRETLDLPLRTFWMMSNNINRVSAEEDMRTLSVAGASQSSEGYSSAMENFQREIGDVFAQSEDEEARRGLQKLKDLHKKMKRR